MNGTGEKKKSATPVIIVLSVLTVFLGAVFFHKLVHLSIPAGIGEEMLLCADLTGDFSDVSNGLFSSENVADGSVSGKILIQNEAVMNSLHSSSWGGMQTLSFEVPGGEEDDLIIFEFTARTVSENGNLQGNPPEGKPTVLEVLFNGDQKAVLEVNDKVNKFYVPFYIRQGGKIMSLRLLTGNTTQKVSVGKLCVTDYGKDVLLSSLKTGRYLAEDFLTVKDEWEKGAWRGDALVSDGSFLYLFRFGELIVYRNNPGDGQEGALTEENISESLTKVGRLTGLEQVYSVRLCRDKKLILVFTRDKGVFFVGIEDPQNPVILSRYKTKDLCYGGDIYGDYAFLCNCRSGMEAVDLSDKTKPEFVCGFSPDPEADYWDCAVRDGILYVVSKEACRLDIYDVRDMGDIHKIGQAELDGQAEALEIREDRLYVATAKDSTYKGTGSEGNIRFMQGSGNGLEVYKFSEKQPGEIQLLYREKADGRTNKYPLDIWDLSISGDYAYVSLMNAGLYIYDIGRDGEIERIEAFHVVAGKDSQGYKAGNPEEDIMPYPVEEESHLTVLHTAVLDGTVFVLTNEGIYRTRVPEQ